MRPEVEPVWLLFRRRVISRLEYWCLVLGFDMRDHSLNNRLYFIYFFLFWAAWAMAIFTLCASGLVDFLAFLPPVLPATLAVQLGSFSLALWVLAQLWRFSNRSPFVFNEPDAYLLCQSPVNRGSIGLAWMLMDWMGTAPIFLAGGIVLAFTIKDANLAGAVRLQDLPAYLVSGLRAVGILLPLQFGVQAGAWGIGAIRLARDKPPRREMHARIPVILAGAALLAAVFTRAWQTLILFPLAFPLQAAFLPAQPLSTWLLQAGTALAIAGSGLLLLLATSRKIHLGRAAQETRLVSALNLARSVQNFTLAESIKRDSRLKVSHSPSRLPARRGAWALVWKSLAQTRTGITAGSIFRWLAVFGLSVSFLLARGWGTQLVFGLVWALYLGNLATAHLRSDLARWWLLRSMPIGSKEFLLAELGPAWTAGLLLGWLGLAGVHPAAPFGWMIALMLPFLAASAALGTARDILDRASPAVLMAPAYAEENVPTQDIQGVLIILIADGVPLGMLFWGMSSHIFAWGILGLLISAAFTGLHFREAKLAYRGMGS